MDSNRKQHWETIYETKTPEQVSWTQQKPEASLKLLEAFNFPKAAKIIDVGGGDSKLVDYLLEQGYENITVLDISASALQRAQQRLGKKAEKVKWVVGDIITFTPETVYDFWHDRAAFHFLTTSEQVSKYLDIAGKAVKGYLAIGTFSDKGPEKCSGLEIRRYSEDALTVAFRRGFNKLRCFTEDHITPFGTRQNFLFCSFRKM